MSKAIGIWKGFRPMISVTLLLLLLMPPPWEGLQIDPRNMRTAGAFSSVSDKDAWLLNDVNFPFRPEFVTAYPEPSRRLERGWQPMQPVIWA